jgi:uncharacterized protein (TIGR02453 family)
MIGGFGGFPPEALRFLGQLKRNNNREWFLAHKDIYEQKLKVPMTELVMALGHELQPIAPDFVVSPQRAIYRIYRDIRFSADKSPYKTHIAAIFVPRGIPKHTGACLYFHVDPTEVLVAGGVYMPDSATLRTLRQYIATHWEELQAILSHRSFMKTLGKLEGDRLTRPPRGFQIDHPAIDILRQKQFYVSRSEPADLAERPALYSRLVTLFNAMMPLVDFLNSPLKPWTLK